MIWRRRSSAPPVSHGFARVNRREWLAAAATTVLSPGWSPTLANATFTVDDNRAILDGARIRGVPVRALFDTGAAISTLTESLARSLAIQGAGSRRINTSNGQIRVRTARDVPFSAPGVPALRGRWAIMPDSLQAGVDCVIGAASFNRYGIAFSTRAISFTAPLPDFALLDVQRAPVPIANFRVSGEPLTMIIDSGANLSSINAGVADRLVGKPGVTGLAFLTAQGPVLRAIRIPLLTCGAVAFDNVLLRVSQGSSSPNVRGIGLDGFMGLDAIKLRDWIFDPRANQVGVSKRALGQQSWIGLGLDFRTDDGDPGRVVALAEGGPGARAGIELGDRIISIDGVTATPDGDAEIGVEPPCECAVTVDVVFENAGVRRTVSVMTAELI